MLNLDQVLSIVRWLMSVGGPLGAYLVSRGVSADQVTVLQSDLQNIDRAANTLSMRHSDLFLLVQDHLDRTRRRLASRLVELRG